MKFSIEDFFSKCDQIRRRLVIIKEGSHLRCKTTNKYLDVRNQAKTDDLLLSPFSNESPVSTKENLENKIKML